jgi:hypothetical protein
MDGSSAVFPTGFPSLAARFAGGSPGMTIGDGELNAASLGEAPGNPSKLSMAGLVEAVIPGERER